MPDDPTNGLCAHTWVSKRGEDVFHPRRVECDRCGLSVPFETAFPSGTRAVRPSHGIYPRFLWLEDRRVALYHAIERCNEWHREHPGLPEREDPRPGWLAEIREIDAMLSVDVFGHEVLLKIGRDMVDKLNAQQGAQP